MPPPDPNHRPLNHLSTPPPLTRPAERGSSDFSLASFTFDAPPTPDDLLLQTGGFGRFQHRVLAAAGAAYGLCAVPALAPVFLVPAIAEAWDASRTQQDLVSSAFFAGYFVGLATLASAADRVGRRPIILLSVVAMFATTLATFLAPNYPVLISLRALSGVFTGAAFNTITVLLVELAIPERRAVVKAVLGCCWPVGAAFFVAVAWLVRGVSWRWMGVAAAAYVPVAVVLLLRLPESPRFLFLQRRVAELHELLVRMAEENDVTYLYPMEHLEKNIPGGGAAAVDSHEAPPKPSMLAALFLDGAARTTLAVGFVQFCANLVYYGVALMAAPAAENAYAAALGGAAAELPGIISIAPLANHLGRRVAMALYLLTGAAALVGMSLALLFKIPFLHFTATLLARLSSAASTTLIYVLAAEAFPTPSRNAGVSWGNACGKLAAALSAHLFDGVPHARLVAAAGSVVAAAVLGLVPERVGEPLSEGGEQGEGLRGLELLPPAMDLG